MVVKKRLISKIRQNRISYIFILPFYIVFAIFGIFPIVYSLYLSFYKWGGIGNPKFVGLSNYVRLSTDRLFWTGFLNNVTIVLIATVPMLILALIIAFILNSKIANRSHAQVFTVCFFTPMLTSGVATALIFLTLYGTKYGVLNSALRSLGVARPIPWLSDPVWIKISLAILLIWKGLGWNMVIYLAGLQGIPESIYDAAKMDGANMPQIFTYITIPLMKPVILFTVVTSTIGVMQLFDEPFMLTGGYVPLSVIGGPKHAILTMMMYLYIEAFMYFKLGYSAAITYLMFFLVIGLTAINLRAFGIRTRR